MELNVKDRIENLYRDRQVYVEPTNTTLVAAALLVPFHLRHILGATSLGLPAITSVRIEFRTTSFCKHFGCGEACRSSVPL